MTLTSKIILCILTQCFKHVLPLKELSNNFSMKGYDVNKYIVERGSILNVLNLFSTDYRLIHVLHVRLLLLCKYALLLSYYVINKLVVCQQALFFRHLMRRNKLLHAALLTIFKRTHPHTAFFGEHISKMQGFY